MIPVTDSRSMVRRNSGMPGQPRMDILTALALAFLLAACAGVNRGSTPEVRLVNLRLGPGGLWEQAFLAEIRITNATRERVSFDGITVNLSLAGRHVASGVSNENIVVSPQDHEDLVVETRTNYDNLVQLLFGYGIGDGVPYAVSGELYVRGIRDRIVPYASRGTLDLFSGGLSGGEPRYRNREF